MSTTLPDQIGPYRLLRPIARGGMAEVYEVGDVLSGEHLALKLLVQTAGQLARFNREYEAMIRLNHPNIVRVYDYGTHEGRPWLTMELIDGTPLQAYAKRLGRPGTPHRTGEVIRTAHDVALALDHIHHRGLVHRDLKSANVLVLPDGRVKLFDFGTAKVSEAFEDITRDGEFIGTFAYASPEQLSGKPVDGRSDLYSLGVLLYRLATGKRPFNAKDLRSLARQHLKEPPRPPTQLVPHLPEGLEQVILSLLEKKPWNRPQTGAEVADALEDVAGQPLFLPGTLDVDLSSERMMGREDQLGVLWRFLDGAGRLDGDRTTGGAAPGAMALVTGLQGSGRHRMMQALEREVNKREWRSLSWFIRRGADDLDALVRMLRKLGASFGSRAPAEVRDAGDIVSAMDANRGMSVAERLEVLRAQGARLVHHRARLDGKPVALLVRGLEHAGPVGFEALVGLREEVQRLGSAVLIIADILETADDPQSLAQKRLPDAIRVSLPPMSQRDVALLVGSLLHRRPPPTALAREIYSASGGLPTYVEEVVKGMVGQGILRVRTRDSNRIEWAAREDMEMPVPDGARDRVLDQLAALPGDRRRILEAMALLGGEGAATVLAGALQCRPHELVPALEDLSNRGWIALEHRQGRPYARWRQILAEPVVAEQMHACRRRLLERLLIAQVGEDPAFAAQIRLLLEVGRLEEAVARAKDWAVHHLAKNRPLSALEVLEMVIPRVEEVQHLDPTERAQMYLLHVTCLHQVRPMHPATSKSLAAASKAGTPMGDPFEAELHLIRARIQRVIGHYPNFRKHLMEAWYLVEHAPPSPLGSTIAGLLGWSNRVQGHVDDAATWHGRARRIAVQVGIPAVRAHADVGVAGWQFARGLLPEAERTAVAATRTFDDVGDIRGLSEALPVWAHSLRLQGRFSEALEVLYRQIPLMRESETPTFYVRLLLATAWCEVDLCRLGRAQEWVDELGATVRRSEHLDLRLEADLVWGRIMVASGMYNDALHKLSPVRDKARAAGLRVIAESAAALIGEAMWALGDQTSAKRAFKEAITKLRSTGDAPATAQACIAQARSMAEHVDPDRLFEPVAEFVDNQPCVTLQVERGIARGRYHRAKERKNDADTSFARVRLTIDKLQEGLNATDQAALRLHPWMRHARKRPL